MGLLRLDFEQRVAALVQNASNYASGLSVALSGASRWSHDDSDSIAAILEKMDATLVRPNTLVMGQ